MIAGIAKLPSVDRLIHEPARLAVMALLAAVEEADFQFIQNATKLTKGNLSVHLSKLEEAGYVAIEKTFRQKYPLTVCRLTKAGSAALAGYRKVLRAVL